MKLNAELIAEDRVLQTYTDLRFYDADIGFKLTEITESISDFPVANPQCLIIVEALCRFEHILAIFDSYLDRLEFMASKTGAAEAVMASFSELHKINAEANRELLEKKKVGDAELMECFPESSLITLRRMQAILARCPDRKNLYKEMAADVVKSGVNDLSDFIKAEAKTALSNAASSTPLAAHHFSAVKEPSNVHCYIM